MVNIVHSFASVFAKVHVCVYHITTRRPCRLAQSKPKGRLKAHDGYSFFIKFYLATLVLLGVMATLFLIGGTTFAKECDMQVCTIFSGVFWTGSPLFCQGCLWRAVLS